MARVGAFITPFVAQVTPIQQCFIFQRLTHWESGKVFSFPWVYPAGDAGVLCIPGSLCVLLLLPPSCHRLLRIANWNNRPGTAGVQPSGMGPGDDGPGLLPKLRENPSLKLRLPGLKTCRLELKQQMTAVKKRGKEREKKKLDQLSVSISSPILWLLSLGTTVASKSQAAQYFYNMSLYV